MFREGLSHSRVEMSFSSVRAGVELYRTYSKFSQVSATVWLVVVASRIKCPNGVPRTVCIVLIGGSQVSHLVQEFA